MDVKKFLNALSKCTGMKVQQIDSYRSRLNGAKIFINGDVCRISNDSWDYAFRFVSPGGILTALKEKRIIKITDNQFIEIVKLCI